MAVPKEEIKIAIGTGLLGCLIAGIFEVVTYCATSKKVEEKKKELRKAQQKRWGND